MCGGCTGLIYSVLREVVQNTHISGLRISILKQTNYGSRFVKIITRYGGSPVAAMNRTLRLLPRNSSHPDIIILAVFVAFAGKALSLRK